MSTMTMSPAPRARRTSIAVVVGSVRPRRIGPHVARWIAELGRDAAPLAFDLVDLRDWPLPFDDEPEIPAHGGYVNDRTKAWSQTIAGYDGFVFVSPQYNWGYPASLKNALDRLYREWAGKAAIIATYGGRGGGKCAAQLRQVLEGLKMRPVATMPALRLSREQVVANSGAIDAATAFALHTDQVRQAIAELAEALADT